MLKVLQVIIQEKGSCKFRKFEIGQVRLIENKAQPIEMRILQILILAHYSLSPLSD